ncbi:hypothetical protein MAPG_10263 [Magnaporthiopsis poae ATCC 64411]|uniref:Uncharacterized protein n=1 Tax=Magnaporthiopsis poae (strain ATCC 64411 / 73-15) TaxID=644358 RepID=A0A0C4EC49_MAGP6|nr:hypothetical protein MAPG_10263 [Magnaporthiopsis poae ATCC 64411]
MERRHAEVSDWKNPIGGNAQHYKASPTERETKADEEDDIQKLDTHWKSGSNTGFDANELARVEVGISTRLPVGFVDDARRSVADGGANAKLPANCHSQHRRLHQTYFDTIARVTKTSVRAQMQIPLRACLKGAFDRVARQNAAGTRLVLPRANMTARSLAKRAIRLLVDPTFMAGRSGRIQKQKLQGKKPPSRLPMELAVRYHLVKGVMQTALGVAEDARLTGEGENDAAQLRSVRCLVEAIIRIILTPDADIAPAVELSSADHRNLDALVRDAMRVQSIVGPVSAGDVMRPALLAPQNGACGSIVANAHHASGPSLLLWSSVAFPLVLPAEQGGSPGRAENATPTHDEGHAQTQPQTRTLLIKAVLQTRATPGRLHELSFLASSLANRAAPSTLPK